MSERKPCIRCGRTIDLWAKSCPFCNWDQAQNAAAAAAQPQPVIDYKPPEEQKLKKRILMGVGGVLLLVASFGIGTVINSDDVPDEAPMTVEEQQATDTAKVSPPLRAQTPLVAAGEGQAHPITTAPVAAPAGGVANDYARHDATAVSSDEYKALAARAAAEEERRRNTNSMIDPRSITGRAYLPPPAPAPRRVAQPLPSRTPARPQTPVQQVRSTRPVPEYQPVPDVRVNQSTTVRLQLLVGSDGRVKEVNIRDGIPGQTTRIVSAVQRWRFKPATTNGTPVDAPYNVEILFKSE